MNTPPRKESESGLYAPVWRKINQMIDYMREISVVNGRDVRVSRTMNGTLLLGSAAVESVSTPGTIRRFLVTEIDDDTITGTDASSGESEVIAKPWRLTRTPFDGQSIEFTDEQQRTYTTTYSYFSAHRRRVGVVTGNGIQIFENQVVVPRYVVGLDYIYAVSVEGGTGVSGASLVDINADGRAWARER